MQGQKLDELPLYDGAVVELVYNGILKAPHSEFYVCHSSGALNHIEGGYGGRGFWKKIRSYYYTPPSGHRWRLVDEPLTTEEIIG
jgi:hypothetical protein